MKIYSNVSWPKTAAQGYELQKRLREQVLLGGHFKKWDDIGLITGVDVSHDRAGYSHAGLVSLDARDFKIVESVRISMATDFPYIPGLLSFREMPVILRALSQLKNQPDILMVDGQGVAHPRGLGVAAHLGVVTGIAAIGVAKSRLVGVYDALAATKGAHTPLMYKNERIGTVLRSKDNCLPLFVSAGHKISQDDALRLTIGCLTRYRLPEPTRLADKLSKQKNGTLAP